MLPSSTEFLAEETRGIFSKKQIKTLKGLKAWHGEEVGCRGKRWPWGEGENARAQGPDPHLAPTLGSSLARELQWTGEAGRKACF